MTRTDHDLAAACAGGDEAAWESFVQRVGPVIWRVTWRIIGDRFSRQSADDIFQEVLLRFLENDGRLFRKYDPGRGSLELYVSLVTRSVVLNHLRANGRRRDSRHLSLQELDPYDSLLACGREEPQAIGFHVEDWQLDAALATLAPREHQVVDMIYRDRLQGPEIALRLGIAEATVRSIKRAALGKLRKFFCIR